MKLGTTELLLLLALAILLFGGSRLAGLGKSLGKGIKEFREEIKSDEKPIKQQKPENPENPENPEEDKESK